MSTYVTDLISVDPEAPGEMVSLRARAVRAGRPVAVGTWREARLLLITLGASPAEARRRIAFAQTGDMYASCTTDAG